MLGPRLRDFNISRRRDALFKTNEKTVVYKAYALVNIEICYRDTNEEKAVYFHIEKQMENDSVPRE